MTTILPLITYPTIDPVLVEIGPLQIRWYALAYIAGLVIGWRYLIYWAQHDETAASDKEIDDFLVWATVGVILGGRLGYVLFYRPGHYLENPADALAIWQGGMSFHGGMLGVALAIVLFARRRGIAVLALADMLAVVAPIGLFFGRIANFINGELYGRATNVPWAMVFPTGGPVPRHPSQLYEALLEGVVLFAFLFYLSRHGRLREWPGALTGVFLAGYGLARFIVEFFREPDQHLGFLYAGATMGQMLSLPMLIAGLVMIWWARRRA